jgi:hypothetical protein
MPTSAILPLFAAVVSFGVLVPVWKGLDFLDPAMVLFYGLLSMVLAGPLTPPQSSRRATLNGAFMAGAISIMITIQALLTVNLRAGFRRLLLPPAAILVWSFALSILAALFLAFLITLASSGSSSGQHYIRFGFLLSLLALVAFARFAPAEIRSYVEENMTEEGLARIGAFLSLGLLVADTLLWIILRKKLPA